MTDTPFYLKETHLFLDDVGLVQNKHLILVLKVVSATLYSGRYHPLIPIRRTFPIKFITGIYDRIARCKFINLLFIGAGQIVGPKTNMPLSNVLLHVVTSC